MKANNYSKSYNHAYSKSFILKDLIPSQVNVQPKIPHAAHVIRDYLVSPMGEKILTYHTTTKANHAIYNNHTEDPKENRLLINEPLFQETKYAPLNFIYFF
jgi:hypothetical protein